MARTPVIFIPGLTGSFNLPVLLDWRGPTLGGWGFPPFVGYGKEFVATFERAGYKQGRDLFVAFYDWRKPVEDSARNYLVGWVDRARRAARSAKVILVGHSMGGLVARSYIQSAAYAQRNDVERLITLGSPHRGSAEAYYAWQGGEPQADQTMRTVFAVYLWYLRHVHPQQTELDAIKTVRTQVPGIRDLLPVEDYVLSGSQPRPVTSMLERNLWGLMANQPASVAGLLARTPVTTITGVGFSTVSAITVGPPPADNPLRYPDGEPLDKQLDGQGDGTVLQRLATIPQARNLPPLNVSHGALPDSPQVLATILTELGVATGVLGAAPDAAPAAQPPTLVIMTASPLTLEVATPAGPPVAPAGVLGAAAEPGPARRPRRVRGRNYGHAGKALNLVVVENPAAGDYRVRLHGTDSGGFAVGALLIGADGPLTLGGAGDAPAQPAASAITTAEGTIARDCDLYYTIGVSGAGGAPTVRLDPAATAAGAVAQLRGALAEAGGVLGGGDPLAALGGAIPAGEDLLRAAIAGDSAAVGQILAAAPAERARLLAALAELARVAVGDHDSARAVAIITALASAGG